MGKPCILIIDDNVALLESKKRQYDGLFAGEFSVLTAEGGKEGLASIEKEHPAVILLDIKMPAPDGWDVLAKIRTLGVSSAVVMWTAYADVDFVVKAMDWGAVNYIHKGTATEEAEVAAVRNALMVHRSREQAAVQAKALNGLLGAAKLPRLKDLYTEIAQCIQNICPAEVETFLVTANRQGKPRIVASSASDELRKSVEAELNQRGLALSDLVQERTVHIKHRGRFVLRCVQQGPYESMVVVPCCLLGEMKPSFVVFLLSRERITDERKVLYAAVNGFAGVAGALAQYRVEWENTRLKDALVAAASRFVHQFAPLLSPLREYVTEGNRQGAEKVLAELTKYSDSLRRHLRGMRNSEPANPIDVNAHIRSVVGQYEKVLTDKDIHVQVETASGLPPVSCGVYAADTILRNLIENAIHSLGEIPDRERVLDIRSWRDRDRVIVTVADNGLGIPDGVGDEVFDAFFTTKGEQGLGLGLAVARGNARTFGGGLTIRPTAGPGVAFELELPVSAEEQGSSSARGVKSRPEAKV